MRGTEQILGSGRNSALVMNKMVPAAEPDVAVLALKRFFPLVDQQMSFELIRVAELCGAELASVRPLAGVNSEMTAEVGDLDELPIAVGAVVGLFSSV